MPLLKVLTVDTDPAALRLLGGALRHDGYDVTAASDFETALGYLSPATFDAVVTAHRLGPHNGLHLLLRARLTSPTVTTVVVSRTGDPYLEGEASALGVMVVTAPDLNPAAVVDALRGAVNSV